MSALSKCFPSVAREWIRAVDESCFGLMASLSIKQATHSRVAFKLVQAHSRGTQLLVVSCAQSLGAIQVFGSLLVHNISCMEAYFNNR